MSIFGWSLPPGCSHSDIERAFGDYEYTSERCPTCGSFVSANPIRVYQDVTETECDGKPSYVEVPYDEILIRILGEEYRGKSYVETYPPTCCLSEFPGETSGHAPHKFVSNVSHIEVRHCKRCNKDVEWAV